MAPRPHCAAAPALAPEARLEETGCPVCGGRETVSRGPEFPPYRVLRCACGLWYLSPRLAREAMEAGYREESYFEGGGAGYSSYLAQEATLRRTFRRLLATLAKQGMNGGRLLEVGCAYGFFLEEAASHFRLRVGTEMSPTAAARSRPRADRVLLGGLEALAEEERFDLVACIHVIEHVYEPLSFLTRLRDHLEPGGWLVVATPDMGGFWRPLLGRRWPFYKAPEHVTYFDRRSLAGVLAAAGFHELRPVAYASFFTLDLVGEKLGLRLPPRFARLQLRLPATTVALTGRR